mmetsp:Transcript_28131/g.39110  ORF Transcript_28131/g.39110 Transcript_28131/m.39110 type:complete len:142 (+) Transcript_28131:88-513(+)
MEPDKSKGFVYRMAEFTWFLMGNVSDLPPYWDVLAVAEAIGDPAQGIITGSIFVVGFREVRETWKGWLCPWIAPSPTNCDAFDNADSEFPHFQRSELTSGSFEITSPEAFIAAEIKPLTDGAREPFYAEAKKPFLTSPPAE